MIRVMVTIAALFTITVTLGCKGNDTTRDEAGDKAKASYLRGEMFESKGDVGKAVAEYEKASEADPSSEFGMKATEKVRDLQPALKTFREKEAKEAELRAAAKRAADEARLRELRTNPDARQEVSAFARQKGTTLGIV